MNYLKICILSLTAAFSLLLSTACGSSSDEPEDPNVPEESTRSVLVYMAANNNLSSYAKYDLEEMKEGAAGIKGGHLLVYYHASNKSPQLLEITPDGKEQTLKTYDTSESSVSIARMREVIADAKALDKSGRLGLILWSHGTGWLSDNGVIEENGAKSAIRPYSFGMDDTNAGKLKMKLTSLRKALEGNTYDFIYFDCCHMATVEVAYELRQLTPQIVACPTELGLDGMPYDLNIPLFFTKTPDLKAAIYNSYNFYKPQPSIGCCISVINTAGLERLAQLSRQALGAATLPAGYKPVPYFRKSIMSSGIYDMEDYYKALLADKASALMAEWKQAYVNVLEATHTTESVYGLDATHFSGLGCNIITAENTPEKYGYNETAWYRDVVAR